MPVMEAGSELCAAERQPGSGISYAGQSQPGPSNVSLDQDRLSWWPGPDRLSGSSISYPSGDHGPSGRLPIPGSRSVSNNLRVPVPNRNTQALSRRLSIPQNVGKPHELRSPSSRQSRSLRFRNRHCSRLVWPRSPRTDIPMGKGPERLRD